MEKSMLTEVKAILKSLVLSSPEKMTVEQLNRDYRDVEGQFIPFAQLGYANLEHFLRSVPDTLKVFGSGPTAMVCFVANEKSDHIHDMIMRQKKSKPKARSRAKSSNRMFNNAYQGASKQPTAIRTGQQLSPYVSVNRNHMNKTIQVRDIPNVVKRINYVPTPVSSKVLYNLPQPNGITLNKEISTIKNGIIKNNNQSHIYQNKVNNISSLLKNQCNVSTPPPPLVRHQNRNVFSSKNVSPIHVEKKPSRESQKQELETFLTEASTSKQIKDPNMIKRVSIKLLDEDEDDIIANMPALSRALNHEDGVNGKLSAEEPHETENIGNIKSFSSTKFADPKRFFEDSAEIAEDIDEAIPSFAAKNNVFRFDFPENTASYGDRIPPYKLSDDIKIGSCVKVFVTEIHSPFKFWFHFYKENHELDNLMYQIERYYSSLDSDELCIPTVCLTPGQVCAASYNGLWHRAKIVAPPVNKKIKLSFIDYGTVTEVEIKYIKFLASAFTSLPAQALRGCLSHIKPRQLHWDHAATNYFLELVTELMLYAEISEIDNKNNVLYMILCDTNGDEVVQINSTLVQNRFASYNKDWNTEKLKQNNGKRLRHPREDFPTFSMIESGEYPSFQELVSLQQRGIDYETIYDTTIYNPSTILNKHESASEGLRNLPYFLTTSNPFRSEVLLELYATTTKVL